MGAILSYVGKDGEEYLVCFASRSCNPAKRNDSSFKGECLIVVWATSHFRPYLFGKPFHLVTDHEPLKWIMTTTKLTGKLARWSLLLLEYDFTVEHRKGVENTIADCLSRYSLPSDAGAPSMEWSKGEIMPVATFLAFMVGVTKGAAGGGTSAAREERDIWRDEAVQHFIQTHKHGRG